MYYGQLLPFDTMNGPGIRVSLFVSGCTLNCKGCFNKSAHNFKYGEEFSEETTNLVLKYLDNKYVDGLSILGGDPLEDKNYQEVVNLIKKVRERFPEKTVWLWTGRTVDQVVKEGKSAILQHIDVLVDGPFIEELRDERLDHRGSSNQCVIKLTQR